MNKKPNSKKSTIKIAILEDVAIVAQAIRLELNQPDNEICAVEDNTIQFLEKIKNHLPDIAIVDLRISYDFQGGFQAIEAMKEISPNTSALVHSAYDSFDVLSRAVELGVKAYVVKALNEKPLPEVIKIVSSGKIYYGSYTKVVEDYLQRYGKQTYK